MLVVGRIVSDNDEKMTDQSVLLEASRSLGSGVRIPLDLSACPSYSMFPGQAVVLEGKNPDGSKFVVSAQKGIPAPEHEAVIMAKDISMVVAAGPFSMDMGALDFAPLDRLLLLALERRPALLILVSQNPRYLSLYSVLRWGRLWMPTIRPCDWAASPIYPRPSSRPSSWPNCKFFPSDAH